MGPEAFKTEEIDKDSTALLIIDMQNDFLHDDGYIGKTSGSAFDLEFRRAAIPYIKRLAQAMRELNVPVIYAQTAFEPDYADLGLPERWRPPTEELQFAVKGTWGVQIVEELTPQPGDYIVEAKCFDKFLYTPLELILRNKGIKTLVFTGVGTNVCVETTLREATGRGFRAIVTSDGTAAATCEFHDAALKGIGFIFGAVMTCEEVIRLFTKG
jgi:ureidoacrylate peracid hydrolase